MEPSKNPRRLGEIVLVLLLLGCAFYVGTRRRNAPALDSPAVVREVQQLKELVTTKYTIQKVVGLKEAKQPLGEESILLVVQAQVLGGVDLDEFNEGDLSWNGPHEVKVRLPAAKILHLYLDEKETKVWDRQITWWTPWVPPDPQLEQKARLEALRSVQDTALKMGILKDAQNSAETLLRQLLKPLGVERVTFSTAST